jgi:hypothetical protein
MDLATDVRDEYQRQRMDDWSDGRLLAAAGDVLSQPKEAPADSFVLHAPLELLARAGLLRHVRPAERGRARQRLVWLAATYANAGEPVREPSRFDAPSIDVGGSALVAAIERGELSDVDRIAKWLGANATPADLRRLLAEPVAASLAAAAHANILLFLLPRVASGGDVSGGILRGPVRELARYPEWRLRWFEHPDLGVAGSPLGDALLDVPMLGMPGSDFIFPIMNQAEESGIAAQLLSGVMATVVDVRVARQELSRIAAWSMLQEPPDHAPYGWSHCLTMPQAVMGLAGHGASPRTAVAVAATHVVGFRAALGRRQLVATYDPDGPETRDLHEAIAAGPVVAAASVWHAPEAELDQVVTELATRASLHHDAHLVKYTLACFDAAGADPDHRRLYLAAAASLVAWWAQHPGDGFFS